jgi:hypothetical protein
MGVVPQPGPQPTAGFVQSLRNNDLRLPIPEIKKGADLAKGRPLGLGILTEAGLEGASAVGCGVHVQPFVADTDSFPRELRT